MTDHLSEPMVNHYVLGESPAGDPMTDHLSELMVNRYVLGDSPAGGTR